MKEKKNMKKKKKSIQNVISMSVYLMIVILNNLHAQFKSGLISEDILLWSISLKYHEITILNFSTW